MTCKTQN